MVVIEIKWPTVILRINAVAMVIAMLFTAAKAFENGGGAEGFRRLLTDEDNIRLIAAFGIFGFAFGLSCGILLIIYSDIRDWRKGAKEKTNNCS